MSVPELFVSSSAPLDSSADVLILGAVKGKDGPELTALPGYESVGESLVSIGVTGAAEQLARIPSVVGSAAGLAIVGFGAAPDADAIRAAAGAAIRLLAGVETVAFAIPLGSPAEVAALIEGAAIGGYAFNAYRGTGAEIKNGVKRIEFHLADGVDRDAAAVAITRASVVASAIATVKDLVNTPPADLYPETLADAAVDAVAGLPIETTIWDEAGLERDGFGGLLGVGKGSSRGPRLVKLSYSPDAAAKHLALVGKGITYDSGGISLKPMAALIGMKYDMTGAATVLATIAAAAKLELPVRITAWMCLAENMPSGTALRPDDILRIRGGKTVEVTNTDAEGRLVLADGLVAASEEVPDAIVDIATLTGAALVALGKRYTGVMGDDALVTSVLNAAQATGEPMWAMPLPEELRANLRSSVADLANTKVGATAGGMLVAGMFLREFIGKASDEDDAPTIPWAHLDIAGPANNPDAAYGFTAGGPSGVGLRTLLKLTEELGLA